MTSRAQSRRHVVAAAPPPAPEVPAPTVVQVLAPPLVSHSPHTNISSASSGLSFLSLSAAVIGFRCEAGCVFEQCFRLPFWSSVLLSALLQRRYCRDDFLRGGGRAGTQSKCPPVRANPAVDRWATPAAFCLQSGAKVSEPHCLIVPLA